MMHKEDTDIEGSCLQQRLAFAEKAKSCRREDQETVDPQDFSEQHDTEPHTSATSPKWINMSESEVL